MNYDIIRLRNGMLQILIVISIYNTFTGCKKATAYKNLNIEIAEYKTNIPVADATINFYKEGAFDFISCFCNLSEKYLTLTTNSDGVCSATQSVDQPDPIEITFDKPGYISKNITTGKNIVESTAQINFHLVQTHNHVGIYQLNISIAGEIDSTSLSPVLAHENDTNVTALGYGDQINSFTWIMIDSIGKVIENGGPIQKSISKTGMNQVELDF